MSVGLRKSKIFSDKSYFLFYKFGLFWTFDPHFLGVYMLRSVWPFCIILAFLVFGFEKSKVRCLALMSEIMNIFYFKRLATLVVVVVHSGPFCVKTSCPLDIIIMPLSIPDHLRRPARLPPRPPQHPRHDTDGHWQDGADPGGQ